LNCRKFSPHDAALDGTISGTVRLSVGDCSLHPGDLGIPVVDDLRVELNLDNLATDMVNVRPDNESLSSTAKAMVNSNDVAWVDGVIVRRHDKVQRVRKIEGSVSLEGRGRNASMRREGGRNESENL